jgi:hypothetical protein
MYIFCSLGGILMLAGNITFPIKIIQDLLMHVQIKMY